MRNSSTEISKQNVKILDFEKEFAAEVLEIQTEANLSFWAKSDYLGELERADSIFKIAQTADRKIIGFALVRLLISSNAPVSAKQNNLKIAFDSSEILNIAVRGSFQKRGVGQMIFDEIVGELYRKNIAEIWLEVRKSNADAINFYRKNDFEMQFERKNYYANPIENACIFRRSMNRSINS